MSTHITLKVANIYGIKKVKVKEVKVKEVMTLSFKDETVSRLNDNAMQINLTAINSVVYKTM